MRILAPRVERGGGGKSGAFRSIEGKNYPIWPGESMILHEIAALAPSPAFVYSSIFSR